MSPKAELVILLDRKRDCFIPGDRVGGRVFVTNQDALDISEICIEFQGIEDVRYNNRYNQNILFNQAQTLMMGPKTLHADKHTYTFEFMFPFPPMTNPTKAKQRGLRSDAKHTLPPSMNHNRPGIMYSFDAIIRYELRGWVKKPKRLGSGDKIAVECREELTFWPTDRNSDTLETSYHDHRFDMEVICEPQHFQESVKGKDEVTVEECEVREHEHEHLGRLSKFFHSKRNSSQRASGLPTEKVAVMIKIPTFLNRKCHNPLSFHASYPLKKDIPELKLCSLEVKVRSKVNVPCMEMTIYGSLPGEGEESYALSSLSEQEDDPLKIPHVEAVRGPLKINLFDDPIQQFAGFNFDFTTFNISRSHNLSVKCRFRCGDEVFDFEKTDLPLTIPLPSSRPTPEQKAVT